MKRLSDRLLAREETLAVVGLGYVGMPLAVAFARSMRVIGYDVNAEKIALYRQGKDPTNEVGDACVRESTVDYTCDEARLREAKFVVVAVPTPINQDKTPQLHPVESASRIVGRNLTPGAIVVYESTVYPGVTEDVCVPILEQTSGLKAGRDFKVGYSPERINPGDRVHTLATIQKIVSGMDAAALAEIAAVYEQIITAGVHRASSIKVAEAAKVVENSQRDVNIAFMNELAMVFDRMGIDTHEVIAAMNTKWNALGFYPGLVGGHCIGVDPYYFVYEAERLGFHSQIILAGRQINDGMGSYVAQAIIKQLALAGKRIRGARVVVLGLTFKENCPDIRNSKVEDILTELKSYGIDLMVADPWADPEEARREYGVVLTDWEACTEADCVVFAVAHREFARMPLARIDAMFAPGPNADKVIIDVKSTLDKAAVTAAGYRLWRM